EVAASPPRLAVVEMLPQAAAQPGEGQLDVAIDAANLGEHFDYAPRGLHADVAMQDGPSDLEGIDQVGVGPAWRPVFQAEVAGGDGAVGGLALGERASLDCASRQQGIRQVC